VCSRLPVQSNLLNENIDLALALTFWDCFSEKRSVFLIVWHGPKLDWAPNFCSCHSQVSDHSGSELPPMSGSKSLFIDHSLF
jgi:hypothetical protein